MSRCVRPVAVLRVADNFFKENPEISRLGGENPIAFGKYHIPWLLNESPDHFASDIAEGRRQMRKLKEREDSLGDDNPGTVVVMHGKYSYPNGLGPDKVRGVFLLCFLRNDGFRTGYPAAAQRTRSQGCCPRDLTA